LNLRTLDFFDTISLSYLEDKALLLNRKEIKFVVSIGLLDLILKDCKDEYYLLKINNESIFKYSTNYYDTIDLQLYFDHHKGKGNRYKIREREYVQSNLKYVEIKTKTNKNQTVKYRKKIKNWFETKDFIQDHTKIKESDLHQSLYSEYTRITLLHKEKKEKVTLDFNLGFYDQQKSIQYDAIVIAEVKAEKITTIHFNEIMKKYKIRSGSLSKYCLGLVSLNPKLKKNNFKMMFNQITKANNNG
jgi:VTC domain